jgi:lysophospholipase L1-like esterase/multisubunit Na+/H+ antiporter MnhG subunit
MSQFVRRLGRKLLGHIGLVRPYRFERTVAAIASVFLGLLLVLLAVVLALNHELGPTTMRGGFFLYVLALLALGFLTLPWPRIAGLLLTLASLEIGLGGGSIALMRAGVLHSSLLPRTAGEPLDGLFEWHPLLQVVPKVGPTDKSASSIYTHNSARLRGQEQTAESLRGKTVIALFGGSSTYGLYLKEDENWTSRLEQTLGAGRYVTLNHGMEGYTTAEHVIQTAFYEQSFQTKPNCALYYVGWNDLRNNYVPDLDPGYADFHLPSQIDFQGARYLGRRLGQFPNTVSPTLNFILGFAARMLILTVDTARPVTAPTGALHADLDSAFVALYIRNIETISAINRQRGIRTLWVGQLLNRTALTSDKPYGWLPLIADKDLWPLMAKLNGVLGATAAKLGDPYIDVPIDDFTGADFFDQGHFTPSGAMKFAAKIAPEVSATCR